MSLTGALVVRIARSTIALELPEGTLRDALAIAWQPFRDGGEPELEIAVELEDAPGLTTPQFPEIRSPRTGLVLVTGEDFEAELEGSRARVRQRISRYPVELATKLLLAARLAQRGGLLLHGVCLADERDAALFVAESGGGKSTLGELGERHGLLRLADELVAVWPEGEGYRAAGTPWNVGRNEERRLVAIGTLGKAAAPRLQPMPPAELLRTLIPNALLPQPTAEGRARLFRHASALLAAAPACRFDFPPTEEAVKGLRTLLPG